LTTEMLAGIDRARLLGQAKQVDVAFDVTTASDPTLYPIDAQSLGRIIDNLLSNAITAVEEGGAITATLTSGVDGLVLAVVDDGPGVPADFVPHAFERFTRADESRTAATGGSGLGLALVRMIAESAGGDAMLANTPPGLTVRVRIPAHVKTLANDAVPS
jgi:signal transduction histidine kinase